jgi:hypothetical protein
LKKNYSNHDIENRAKNNSENYENEKHCSQDESKKNYSNHEIENRAKYDSENHENEKHCSQDRR